MTYNSSILRISLCLIITFALGKNLFSFHSNDFNPPLENISIGDPIREANQSVLCFDFEKCEASDYGSDMDYTEFQGVSDNESNCASLTASTGSGHVYRPDPFLNKHSCTWGVDGGTAMCIGGSSQCTFRPDNDQSVWFDFRVAPKYGESISVSDISFFVRSPDQWQWFDGRSGPNNAPRYLGIRIMKGTKVVYFDEDIEIGDDWQEITIDLFGDPDFTGTSGMNYRVEILGYCPRQNGGDRHIWDIDNIKIHAGCTHANFGGEIGTTFGNTFAGFCTNDGEPDIVETYVVREFGSNFSWLVTDESGQIVIIQQDNTFDFEGSAAGTCQIWHISYESDLTGFVVGNNVSDLGGCFGLSNPININKDNPTPSIIEFAGGGDSRIVCPGNGISDPIDVVILTPGSGEGAWVQTDANGEINGFFENSPVDFEDSFDGDNYIYYVNFIGEVDGLEIGNNINTDVSGCFAISNVLEILQQGVDGGTLTIGGSDFVHICTSDDTPDILDVDLDGAVGESSSWVITNQYYEIIGLPLGPPFDFTNTGLDFCFVYHVSSADGVTGAALGGHISTITGCVDLSNRLVIQKNNVDGGTATTLDGLTATSICTGEGAEDLVTVTVDGNTGDYATWIIAREDGTILATQTSPELDLSAYDGRCLIYSLSYTGAIDGLNVEGNISGLSGCYDLSSPVTVTKENVNGGVLTNQDGTTEETICVGGITQVSYDVNLVDQVGSNSVWILTSMDDVILSLPVGPPFNFSNLSVGQCKLFHMSYGDGLSGLVVQNDLGVLAGCFDLSNPIVLTKDSNDGGQIATTDGQTVIEVCAAVDDGLVDLTLQGDFGDNSAWIIVDSQGDIVDLPLSPPFDFSNYFAGSCFIYHMRYTAGLSGLSEDNNLDELDGCYDLSNPVEVIKYRIGGGFISTPDGDQTLTVCAGDGVDDNIEVNIVNEFGRNSTWVITDPEGTILEFDVQPPFNFENAGTGTCLIWHISSENAIVGVGPGDAASDIVGCVEFSNPLTVIREGADGGNIQTVSGETEVLACIGNGQEDLVNVVLNGETGDNSLWVITGPAGVILDLPESTPFDFENAGEGVCFIYNLSYTGPISGINLGQNIANVQGCYGLSNPISVERKRVEGGFISIDGGQDEVVVCVGDGVDDFVDVGLVGDLGTNAGWVITDENGLILDLPSEPPFNFEGAGIGICLLWHINYEDGLTGLATGNNANNLEGCYDLSNPITIIRNGASGGTIATADGATDVDICVGDGDNDLIDVVVSGATGNNGVWVVTDEDLNILMLPLTSPLNLEGLNVTTCQIWYLSYENVVGLSVGANGKDIQGCYGFSNPITVNKDSVAGGLISYNGQTILDVCISGGENGGTFTIDADGNQGEFSSWVVTDLQGTILDLPAGPTIDFTNYDLGICQLWLISYNGRLNGFAVGENVSNITGCFEFSNSISVNKKQVEGGVITTTGGSPFFSICSTDDAIINFTLDGNIGEQSIWLVTSEDGDILTSSNSGTFDFSSLSGTNCLVYHVSYCGLISNAIPGNNIDDLDGCYDVSNSVSVTKRNNEDKTEILFDLNACDAYIEDGSNRDYSEFTAQTIQSNGCVDLDIVGGNLYRENASSNRHSCTEGLNGTTAMCIQAEESCNSNNYDTAVQFDVLVTPEPGGVGTLCLLSFYENAPEIFTWIDGGTGLNNYPTRYAVRVSVDNVPIFISESLATSQVWSLETISFAGNDNFTVDSPTVFHIELLAYCPVGNASDFVIWDLDNISVQASCGVPELDGGIILAADNSNIINVCADDRVVTADDLIISNHTGSNSTFVVYEVDGNILVLASELPLDISSLGIGSYNLAYLAHDDIDGLVVGSNINNLDGCFDFSNEIIINILDVDAGEISTPTGESLITVCNVDGTTSIFSVNLQGPTGTNNTFLVTDGNGTIIQVSAENTFDFSGSGSGVCFIYNLSYQNGTAGFQVGNTLDQINGCYDISNSIQVNKQEVEGGVLSANGITDLSICTINDDESVINVDLINNQGELQSYLLVDENGVIVNITNSSTIDVSNISTGTCFIYSLSYDANVGNLVVGGSLQNINGCAELSNPVTITKVNGSAGNITTAAGDTAVTICTQDGSSDLFSVVLNGASAGNNTYVVTQEDGTIIEVTQSNNFDFESFDAGVCQIYNVNLDSSTTGLNVGGNINSLVGCYSISNPITVTKRTVNGGEITTDSGQTEVTVCSSDDINDFINVNVSNALGEALTIVVLNSNNEIVSIANGNTVDVTSLPQGTCFIYNLSHQANANNIVIGGVIANVSGCTDLSNPIEVNKTSGNSGTIASSNGSDNFTVCVGDGSSDLFSVTLNGASAGNNSFVVTNEDGIITQVTQDGNFDFDTTGSGRCIIYNVNYSDDVGGLSAGNNINNLSGCTSVSNPIRVLKQQVNGGSIATTSGETELVFCAIDESSSIVNVVVGNASGEANTLVLVDENNVILAISNGTTIDLTNVTADLCFIYNISHSTNAGNIAVGSVLSSITGCTDLSNPITITKGAPSAGSIVTSTGATSITICTGDGVANTVDVVLTGASNTNNSFVVTDANGFITEITTDSQFDFENSPSGICNIYSVNFDDSTGGLIIGNNINNLSGCTSVTNPIVVNKMQVNGGTIATSNGATDLSFCLVDGTVGIIDVVVNNNAGEENTLVLLNENNVILAIANGSSIDLTGISEGICFIYNLSHSANAGNLTVGSVVTAVTGCTDLSNPITVRKDTPDPGSIATSNGATSLTVCTGDGLSDAVSVVLTGASTTSNTFVVTDANGNISSITTDPNFEFENSPTGVCNIYSVNFDNSTIGLTVGGNINNLSGCTSVTNPIQINKQFVNGGSITTDSGQTSVSTCGNDQSGTIVNVNVSGVAGEENTLVVVNSDNVILSVLNGTTVDVSTFTESICFIYNVSHQANSGNIAVNSSLEDITGCNELSNPISVTKANANAGSITTASGDTAITICTADGSSDLFTVQVNGASGTNNVLVVTDENGNITQVSDSNSFDFESSASGVCNVYNVNYESVLPTVGANVNNIQGCSDVSNPVVVTKRQVNGGSIASNGQTNISICAEDDDLVVDVEVTNAIGEATTILILDGNNQILGISNDSSVELSNINAGSCFIYNLSHQANAGNIVVGGSVSNITGCTNLSNPIVVTKNGGSNIQLSTSTGSSNISVCASDDQADDVTFVLEGNTISNGSFVITDSNQNVLGITTDNPINLSSFNTAECLVYYIDQTPAQSGLQIGQNLNSVSGCSPLSNSVRIVKLVQEGGTLSASGGAVDITVCTSNQNDVLILDLVGAAGDNSVYAITDGDGTILQLSETNTINLNSITQNECFIYHISFIDSVDEIEVGDSVFNPSGCSDISNSIRVIKSNAQSGSISIQGGGTSTTVCVGEGTEDLVATILQNNSGQNFVWLITDSNGIILEQAASGPFSFEDAPAGTCFVYHLAYNGTISGLQDGQDVDNLVGCFDLSNAITVNRITGADCPGFCSANGGSITLDNGGTTMSICQGDNITESINVNLSGESGTNSNYLITDTDGTILEVSAGPPFNFENAGAGTCLIWHISYENDTAGLLVGQSASDITGCHSLSNSITINRDEVAPSQISLAANGASEVTICLDDDMSNSLDVNLTTGVGANTGWIITDLDGTILDLPVGPPFDFTNTGGGSCLIWHISFVNTLTGAVVGQNATDLSGCFALSNSIRVNRLVGDDCPGVCNVDGGTIALDDGAISTSVCIGEGTIETLTATVTGQSGQEGMWIIADEDGDILDLNAQSPFNFENAGTGTCLIWYVSYDGDVDGLEVGGNTKLLQGCFDLSNSIQVIRNQVAGGTISLEGGDSTISVCVDDGLADVVSVSITGDEGVNSQYLITDREGVIQEISTDANFDFEGVDAGVCLIWHLAYVDVDGLAVGQNANNLSGCFSLSNAITVNRLAGADCPGFCAAEGGSITFGDGSSAMIICSDDGTADNVDVIVTGNAGTTTAWVITDADGEIVSLPASFPSDFEGVEAGVCLIWSISYEAGLTGLEVGSNASGLAGCFDLSNSITLTRQTGADCPGFCAAEGGSITFADGSSAMIICSDDGTADNVDVIVTGNAGTTTAWVITDADGEIVSLPASFPSDFEGVEAGVCLIWSISYEAGLTGLEVGSNASGLAGCFDLSNSITLTRQTGADCPGFCVAEGGSITFADGSSAMTICSDDGAADNVDVIVTGNVGTTTAWVITDADGEIISLPASFPSDFEGVEAGVCLIWSISYEAGLTGLEVGSNASGLAGCFDLSNSITLTRQTGADCPMVCNVSGGMIALIPAQDTVTICVGDGTPDPITPNVRGNIGSNGSWVITNGEEEIIEVSSNATFDFESLGAGTCIVRYISFEAGITGLMPTMNIDEITGCFALSNPIVIIRNDSGEVCEPACNATGGSIALADGSASLTICADDGVSDAFDVTATGGVSDDMSWVITDQAGIIISTPTGPSFDLEGADSGVCLLRAVYSTGTVTGLDVDADINNAGGCVAFSNPITISRNTGEDCVNPCDINGGTALAGGEFEFEVCADDGISDAITIVVTGNTGPNSTFVQVDANDVITAVQVDPSFELEGSDAGVCTFYSVDFEEGIQGLVVGANRGDVQGCFSFSNAINVTKNENCAMVCEATVNNITIDGTRVDTTLCLENPMTTIDVVSMQPDGLSVQWLITDENDNIINLPIEPPFDFAGTEAGTCKIYAVTFTGELGGLQLNNNITDLTGCRALSNAIAVNRIADCGSTCNVMSGNISFDDGSDQQSICIGDLSIDMVDVTLPTGNGDDTRWLITTLDSTIIVLPNQPPFNLEGTSVDACLIWLLTFDSLDEEVTIGNNLADLSGCFALSNSLEVTKERISSSILTTRAGQENFEICVGDGMADVFDFNLDAGVGAESTLIVTDASGIITDIPEANQIDFESSDAGVCRVYHVTYNSIPRGFAVGVDINTLTGCFALSNFVSIDKKSGDDCGELCVLSGGMITTVTGETRTSFCIDDMDQEILTPLRNDSDGDFDIWVVTDDNNMILALPTTLPITFEGVQAGTCFVYNLSFTEDITGNEVGNSLADIMGCFGLSNALQVDRLTGFDCQGGCNVTGASLTLDNGDKAMSICSGDGLTDSLQVNANGGAGANISWVITDDQNTILALPAEPPFDLEGTEAGVCWIRQISWSFQLDGLEVGANLSAATGCFAISDSIAITREFVSGGTLTTTDGDRVVEYCVGDDTNNAFDVTLADNSGVGAMWVITDEEGRIVGLPADGPFDFESQAVGTCLLYNLSFNDSIPNIAIDATLSELTGCFGLSNPITVFRVEGVDCPGACTAEGGTIVTASGDMEVEICAGDGVPDPFEVMLDGAAGDNSLWVITDIERNILSLQSNNTFDLESAGGGFCLIWHISSSGDAFDAQVGDNINELRGCFDRSNSITVQRQGVDGGVIATTDGSDDVTICADDSFQDLVDVTLDGSAGNLFTWVITDGDGVVLDLPSGPPFNFEGLEAGECFIWNLSTSDNMLPGGLAVGSNVSDLNGCMDLSNSIRVNRLTGADCGSVPSVIVINEVISSENRVEIKNVGSTTIDVSGFWICNLLAYDQLGDLDLSCGTDFVLDPGEIITVSTAAVDVSNADGEIGLYLTNDFGSADAMIDYVQWGFNGHPREETAVQAGLWTAGDFVPAFLVTESLSYDGDGNASSDWTVSAITPCADNALQPSRETTVNIVMYPIPATDRINVKFGTDKKEMINVEIFDSMGKKVMTDEVLSNKQKVIMLNDMNKGVYYLRATAGDKSNVSKFMKVQQ